MRGNDYEIRSNYFTDTQIEELTRSNWVKSVSEANVTFTEDFKKEFILDHQNGIGSKQIIRNHGIDPLILGKNRIVCLTVQIKKNLFVLRVLSEKRIHPKVR
jgi:hypothetical protein